MSEPNTKECHMTDSKEQAAITQAFAHAFITSETDGAKGLYQLVAKFKTLAQLQAAHSALAAAIDGQLAAALQGVQPSLIGEIESIALTFAAAYEAAGRETYREDVEKMARKARQELAAALQSVLARHPATQVMDAKQYRMIGPGELIEAGDQFLRDDFTWQADPHKWFVGTPYGYGLRPARRAIATQAGQGAA